MNDEGWICECSYWNRPTHPSSESPSNCQICGRPRPRRQNERVHTGTKQMIHSPPAINQQWMFTHRKSASTLPSTAHPKRHGSKSQKQSGTIHKSITSYGLVGNAAHSHFQSANMSRHVNRQVCAANKQPQRATRHIQNHGHNAEIYLIAIYKTMS
eukprot:94144_1